MAGRLFSLARGRSPIRDAQRRVVVDTVTRLRAALDGETHAHRPRPGDPNADNRPLMPAPPRADSPSRYRLGGWLEQHDRLEPDQRSELLASAFLMLQETKGLITQAREQLEETRRHAADERDSFETRLRETGAERRELAERLKAERAELEAALARVQAERNALAERLETQAQSPPSGPSIVVPGGKLVDPPQGWLAERTQLARAVERANAEAEKQRHDARVAKARATDRVRELGEERRTLAEAREADKVRHAAEQAQARANQEALRATLEGARGDLAERVREATAERRELASAWALERERLVEMLEQRRASEKAVRRELEQARKRIAADAQTAEGAAQAVRDQLEVDHREATAVLETARDAEHAIRGQLESERERMIAEATAAREAESAARAEFEAERQRTARMLASAQESERVARAAVEAEHRTIVAGLESALATEQALRRDLETERDRHAGAAREAVATEQSVREELRVRAERSVAEQRGAAEERRALTAAFDLERVRLAEALNEARAEIELLREAVEKAGEGDPGDGPASEVLEALRTERDSLAAALEVAQVSEVTLRGEIERIQAARETAEAAECGAEGARHEAVERLAALRREAAARFQSLQSELDVTRASLASVTARTEEERERHQASVGRLERELAGRGEAHREIALAREAMEVQTRLMHEFVAGRRDPGEPPTSSIVDGSQRELDRAYPEEDADEVSESVPEYEVDLTDDSVVEARPEPPETTCRVDVPATRPQSAPARVHAMLRMDGVRHLHGCFEPDEIPTLLGELHCVDWLSALKVAICPSGGHPQLAEVGMPMPEFLFGVIPDYVLEVATGWTSEGWFETEGTGTGDSGQQLSRLLEFHDVLTRLAEHALSRRAVAIASGPGHLSPGDGAMGVDDDPLATLAALYAEVVEIGELVGSQTGDDLEATLAGLEAAVAPCAWRRVDGTPVCPVTRTKLLYLLTRCIYSFQLCVLEAFDRARNA